MNFLVNFSIFFLRNEWKKFHVCMMKLNNFHSRIQRVTFLILQLVPWRKKLCIIGRVLWDAADGGWGAQKIVWNKGKTMSDEWKLSRFKCSKNVKWITQQSSMDACRKTVLYIVGQFFILMLRETEAKRRDVFLKFKWLYLNGVEYTVCVCDRIVDQKISKSMKEN